MEGNEVDMESRASSRRIYLDVLRVLASFLVCYNHSFAYHLFLEQEADGSIISWLNVFLSAITTMDIPLFFLISGALLLGKQESYETVWKKRIQRILVLIFAACLVAYLLLGERPLSAGVFFRQLLSGTVHVSHWYLYAYLGYLIFLPILRKIANQITARDIMVLTGLRIFFAPFMMTLNYWLGYLGLEPLVLSGSLTVPLIGYDCFFCPLVGYYMNSRAEAEQMTKKRLWGWVAVFFSANMLASFMTYAEGAHTGFTQNYIGMCRFLSAMAVFALAQYVFDRIRLPRKLETLIVCASTTTLGIYLLEPIVSHYLRSYFFRRVPWLPVDLTVASVQWCFVCMAVAGSITLALRKIPGVQKYL